MGTNKIFVDIAQRAREFAEMCDRMANEINAAKEDIEAWRQEYRKKQAAGVRFEVKMFPGVWAGGMQSFHGKKEDYREVPQKFDFTEEDLNNPYADANKEKPVIPHLHKPTKLTAKIVRLSFGSKVHDWEFYGTPEEYRVECESYGYVVVSKIKEVVEKPKTVTHYFALVIGRLENGKSKVFAVCGLDKEQLENSLVGCSIVGDIEERKVEVGNG